MKPLKPIVAITGGLGDIGRAVGKAFADLGYHVALSDLAAAAPADFSGHYKTVDVCDEASLKAWFDDIQSHFGAPPAVTIVNAAVVLPGSAMTASSEEWTRTMNVNLTGAWLTAKEAASRLLEAASTGSILFVGSWVGQYVDQRIAAYCASKAALHSLAQAMALELADKGIRVNEVEPGYVDGGLSGKIFQQNPGLAESSRLSVPVKKLISPEEVARMVVFITDPANPNLTGSTLILDGGLSLMHGPQHLKIAK